MARIDQFLANVVRMNARGMQLRSDQAVTLRYADGDKPVSHKTPHDDLVSLLGQIAPPMAKSLFDSGQVASFPYQSQGRTWMVHVRPARGTWVATFMDDAASGDEELVGAGVTSSAQAVSSSRSDAEGEAASGAGAAAAARTGTTAAAASARNDGTNAAGYTAGAAGSPGAASSVGAAFGAAVAGLGAVPKAPPPRPQRAVPSSAPNGGPTALEKLLIRMIEMKASDLHLTSGYPPMLRVHGEVKPMEGMPPCDPATLLNWMMEIAPEKYRDEFEERHDTDFAHTIEKVSRFRANYFRDRRGPGAVFRAIPFEILTPEQLGLPKQVLDLCQLTKGLVLVTGPTGSGKSTTLATLVDLVNRSRHDHIITIEDPIEFVHENRSCLVNQREVGNHTRSFKDALRAALREDPDIVLVGELRDLETIAIAVETAETGHLVFGTLHTSTAPSTVDRIIDQFPADRQEQIRQMLSESLRGVIAQSLCRKIGGGRVAAYEILIGSSAVSNLIRERKTYQLWSLMQTGRAAGMVTLNDSLVELVKKKIVEPMEAYRKAVNRSEFRTTLEREGIKLPGVS